MSLLAGEKTADGETNPADPVTAEDGGGDVGALSEMSVKCSLHITKTLAHHKREYVDPASERSVLLRTLIVEWEVVEPGE